MFKLKMMIKSRYYFCSTTSNHSNATSIFFLMSKDLSTKTTFNYSKQTMIISNEIIESHAPHQTNPPSMCRFGLPRTFPRGSLLHENRFSFGPRFHHRLGRLARGKWSHNNRLQTCWRNGDSILPSRRSLRVMSMIRSSQDLTTSKQTLLCSVSISTIRLRRRFLSFLRCTKTNL